MAEHPLPDAVSQRGESLAFPVDSVVRPTWVRAAFVTVAMVVLSSTTITCGSAVDVALAPFAVALSPLFLGAAAFVWFQILPVSVRVSARGLSRGRLPPIFARSVSRVTIRSEGGFVTLEADGQVLIEDRMPWSARGWSAMGVRALAGRMASILGAEVEDRLEDEATFRAHVARRWEREVRALGEELASLRQMYPEVYDPTPTPPRTRTKLDRERYHVFDGAEKRGMGGRARRYSIESHEPISLDARDVGVLGRSWPLEVVQRAFVTVLADSPIDRLQLSILVEGERHLLMVRRNQGNAASEMRWIAQRIEECAATARANAGTIEVPQALGALTRGTAREG